MASTLNVIRESLRQEVTGDDKFYKKLVYFFELRIPAEIMGLGVEGEQSSFLFPLMLNPQSISWEEIFTVEVTPTQGSGLYVEENGVVQRMLRISGHTGFKPRRMPATTPYVMAFMEVDRKSYGRALPSTIVDDLSGQRHFQYLQDSVFRTYSDLKRDPSTSENTTLLWHNPKDDEHWIVVPQRFSLERSTEKPIHYNYNIELIAVKQGEAVDEDFSEDKGLLDSIKDGLRMIQSGIDMVSGAINDLTALAAELESMVKDVGKIINSVSTVIDAASNFVQGVSDLIQSPLALVESIGGVVDSALNLRDTVEQAVEDITNLPDNIVQKFRQIGDGADRIATHPEAFETPTAKKVRETKKRQELLASISRATRDLALATAPPSTLDASRNLGTAITAGDVRTAKSELGAGRDIKKYTSVRARPIEQGDTLVNLAAKYLGDARLWQQIAIANGMQPPFVNDLADAPIGDESVFHAAISTGGTILIPNYSRPLQKQPVLPVLGVRPEKPAPVHFLGSDLKMSIVGGRPGAPLFDWEVDVEGGSVDARQAEGLENIKQALQMRLATEKGSNQLYKRVGVERIVGMKNIAVDTETARYRLTQALMGDTRVAAVRQIKFNANGDALEADITVQLRGFNQPTTVRVSGL